MLLEKRITHYLLFQGFECEDEECEQKTCENDETCEELGYQISAHFQQSSLIYNLGNIKSEVEKGD